ncbi:MAG: sensor histidine kinase [Thermoleophilia bacterium]
MAIVYPWKIVLKRLKTLRVRFALWVAGLLLVALASFGIFIFFIVSHELSGSIDDSLRLSTSQTIAGLDVVDGRVVSSDSVSDNGSNATDLRERGLTIILFDPDGQMIQSFGSYQDLPLAAESLKAARNQRSSLSTLTDLGSDNPVRLLTEPVIENGSFVGVLLVAQSLSEVQATLHSLLIVMILGVPLLIAIAGLGGFFLAARALSPIDQITRTAARISGSNLSARLDLPETDDEAGRLARTFDDMLSRLEASFRRQQQFTADASHELRTPLAAVETILGVMRERRRTAEDYQQAMEDIGEEAERMRNLVANLLQLARSDSDQSSILEQVDLTILLRDVLETIRPFVEAKELSLTYSLPDGLTLLGDCDNLIRLFVNLLDNAVKYTNQGKIAVEAQVVEDKIRISISDTGVGIPAEHLPHIFDRFYRAAKSRASRGSGLGLAIAMSIARVHLGTIEVQSQVAVGTTLTVCLPASK